MYFKSVCTHADKAPYTIEIVVSMRNTNPESVSSSWQRGTWRYGTTVTTKFHQYTGMQHRYGCWRTGVTIRRPCVEWEQRTEDTETDEEQWEEHVLHALWNA